MREPEIVECGCCGAYHKQGFSGDCRSDFDRFPNWQCDRCTSNAEIVVKTRFGFEPVCRKCAVNLRIDGLVLEERGD